MRYAVLGLILALPLLAAGQTGGLVDIVWQAETYTPAGYGGHSLVSPSSRVRVAAIATGLGNPNTLIYKWRKDDRNLPGASGAGKHTLDFQAETAGAHNLEVVVTNPAGQELARKEIFIPIVKPELLVNQSRSGEEIELTVEPYFFSTPDVLTNRLVYDWRINGQSQPANTEDGRRFKIIAPVGARGLLNVLVSAKNENLILQAAQTTLNLSVNSL